MTTLEQLPGAFRLGKSKDAGPLAQRARDENVPPANIVNHALVPAMALVGERFKRNDRYAPVAGSAVEKANELVGAGADHPVS